MGKIEKTSIYCDCCKNVIVENINTDIPWHAILTSQTKDYYEAEDSNGVVKYCCSLNCVTKILEQTLMYQPVSIKKVRVYFEN